MNSCVNRRGSPGIQGMSPFSVVSWKVRYIYMYLYFLSQVALIPKGARMRRARKKYIYGLHNELVLTFEKKKIQGSQHVKEKAVLAGIVEQLGNISALFVDFQNNLYIFCSYKYIFREDGSNPPPA